MAEGETHRAIEAIFRIERARLIAGLARVVRDVDRAEELAQDALVIALAEWPKRGVPANPGAWLMTAAKRRAIDAHPPRQDARRASMRRLRGERRRGRRRRDAATPRLDDDIGDELLGLIFTACHPILSRRCPCRADAAGGWRADDRRDRPRLPVERGDDRPAHRPREEDDRKAGLSFEVPRGAERAARLSSVLEVLYLIFNEGYARDGGRRLGPAGPVPARRSGSGACWPG